MRTRIVEAVVDDWTDDGSLLRLEMPEGADWSIIAAKDGEEVLNARCVVPAMFDPKGRERGSALYLRPGKGDPRTVVLTQGGVPVSPGASTGAWTEFDDDGIDVVISSRKTTVSLKDEGFFCGNQRQE